MNDEVNDEVTATIENVPDELETLKARADLMGIPYHNKIGIDKLKAKLAAKQEPEVVKTQLLKTTINKKRTYLTHEEYKKERALRAKRDLSKQIRIRLSCNNPNKKNDELVFVSVGSAKMGTFKEYIPLDWEAGWHVSQIVYNALKEKKYSKFYTVKGLNGQEIRKSKLLPEFVIDVLDPLTKDELEAMKQQQAIASKD